MDGDDLEARLRAGRPEAPDELVRSITARAGRRAPVGRPAIAFAVVLTSLVVASLAAFGGLGYATNGISNTYSSAQNLFTGNPSTNTGDWTPSHDQYDMKGKIIVYKKTYPDGDYTKFTFVGDPAGQIKDGEFLWERVPAGIYQSKEIVPAGWKLWDITCYDSNSSGDEATATATFNVSPGEIVICVFTNKKKPKIIVKKKTYPSDDYTTTFSFSGTLSGTLKNGESKSMYVDPGTYYTTEAVKDGWELYDIDCDDSDSYGDESNRKATFKVSWGETVTCTFTNKKY
jgi:hypothetical protein